MTAIITSNFRLSAAKQFATDLETLSNYYMFIGKPLEWLDENTPDTPYDNNYMFKTDAWNNMIALKTITSSDWSFNAYRYAWVSGTVDYTEYDDQDTTLSTKKYYVITESSNVYLLLKKGAGASTVNPDVSIGTNTIDPDPVTNLGADGYLWKYMFTLDPASATKFLTNTFIPVKELLVDPGVGASVAYQTQWNVQQNAVAGTIFNIKITDGGTGYTSAPTVVIDGDGTGAVAVAELTGGIVTNIAITVAGSGYNNAVITLTGGAGTGATARAVLSPTNGFGAKPINDLSAHFIGLSVTLSYAEGAGDFPVAQDFRQVGIVKNPLDFGTTTVSTATTMDANTILTVAPGGAFAADQKIEGSVSGAQAWVVAYTEDTNGYIRYIQDETTGFTPFDITDLIFEVGTPGSTYATSVINNSEVERFSGEVVFIENRTAINRAPDQIETIKIVLEF